MHVFQIKGFQGLLMFMLALAAAALILFVIPTGFMMVLWNAVVFEGLRGPEIGFTQGLLLWLMVMITIKLVFKPEIEFQMTNVSDPSELEKKFPDLKKKSDTKE